MKREKSKKHWIYICLCLSFSLILAGCQDKVDTYTGTQGAYFCVTEPSNGKLLEQTNLPFALTESPDSLLRIRIKIIGAPVPYDRETAIKIIEKESTVVPGDHDPVAGTYKLPADSIYGYAEIMFHKQGSLHGHSRTLTIALVPNKYFDTPLGKWQILSTHKPVDVLKHRIVISDKMVELPGFNTFFFGSYSQKKMNLLCKLFHLTWHDFLKPFGTVATKAMGQNLDRYLKEMQRKGTPVYEDAPDENGEPVLMTAGKGIFI